MGGRGGTSGIAPKNEQRGGISILQGAVSKARTDQLMGVHDTLAKKNIRTMTNEEKMVRATVIDELAKRGKLIYDPKDGSYSKAKAGQSIVFYGDKSYRIAGTESRALGTTERTYAKAEYYYGGKWHPVKNPNTLRELAKAKRKK